MKKDKKTKLNKKILITGGGSGGHVSAALSIIYELDKKYSNTYKQIYFIGGKLTSEGSKSKESYEAKRLKPIKNLQFYAIRAGKLQRYLSLNTFKNLFFVLGGFIDSYKLLKKINPDLIISTGGYVTLPVCLVGYFLKIPVYIHEQTSQVGLTNLITSKVATKVFIAFKSSQKYFPKKKTIFTGNLIRAILFSKPKKTPLTQAVQKMVKAKNKYPIIYISGGGLGSHKLNIIIRQMLPYLIQKYQVIHQTGDIQQYQDYEILYKEQQKLATDLKSRYYPTKWVKEEEIGFIFKNVDMFIGRAGANTVYELGVFGIPSILIPIPWVTHNEQYHNAQALKKIGLGVILPEGELTPEKLFFTINKLNKKRHKLLKELNEGKKSKLFPIDGSKKVLKGIGL